MQLVTNDGLEALKLAWRSMPQEIQAKMQPHQSSLRASARAIDEGNAPDTSGYDMAPDLTTSNFNPAAPIQKQQHVIQNETKPDGEAEGF